MNIPNALTLLRIFFVPVLVALLVQEKMLLQIGPWALSNELVALCVFLVAAFTDLLDGYLARRWNQITTVGMLLDPIADKLLISASLVALVQIHRVPGWMAVLIIGREFVVSGLRSIAAAEGYTIAAGELGKSKMVAQVAAIALVLLSIDFPVYETAAWICLWGSMAFALASAAQYFGQFWRKVDEGVKARRRMELLQLEGERRKTAMRVSAEAEKNHL
ncbi:MAG: CDP-diacylglycerol--glycerol-3-phosphate 3-phosphatidyltransferase [Bryobacteraceae bacterium]|nr:CDP-diacylglycerol--glycerol-3-phosphate 3-phosphatidyltransferase [Bryobacteraceae bacterium]